MDYGGMEAVIMSLYRSIDREEWQFDFAVHGENKGFYESEILKMGGTIYRFPMMRKDPQTYRHKWDEFWQCHNGEYYAFQMHTNSLANIVALKSAKRYNIPVRAIYAHSSYADKGRLQLIHDVVHKWNRKRISKYANVKFACSELAAKWMYGVSSTEDGSVIIVNNGIDYDRFNYDEAIRIKLRHELNIENKYVLCQVGHMISVKNHTFTISLLRQLPEDVVCLFLGDGLLQSRLQDMAESQNVSRRIIFLGMRSNVEDYLSASDAFILPSLYEGMPLSVVEAQISGLPCLISSTITRMAQITNNVSYLSINNSSEWAKAIATLRESKVINRDKLVLDNKFDIRVTSKEYIKKISIV